MIYAVSNGESLGPDNNQQLHKNTPFILQDLECYSCGQDLDGQLTITQKTKQIILSLGPGELDLQVMHSIQLNSCVNIF